MGKFGHIAIVGRANVGKSTLLNALIGEKVSIVSPKAQTTRDNILGMYQDEDSQIIFFDTPGIHRADNALSQKMMKNAYSVLDDVDGVLVMFDGEKGFAQHDYEILEKFSGQKKVILAVNKMDSCDRERVVIALQEFQVKFPEIEVFPISALKKKNLEPLLQALKNMVPDGEKVYDEDFLTDKNLDFLVAERIREKALFYYQKEIPHGIMVKIRKFKFDKKKNLYTIYGDIICEKQSHKGIIIGKGGAAMKNLSEKSRLDIERLLGAKVFLTLYVVVKENWRENEKLLNQLNED